MTESQDKKLTKHPGLQTTHALIDVDVTQKIEFDYEKVVGGGSKTSSIAKILSNEINLVSLLKKKNAFTKKPIPDDYVKVSSIGCIISSIATLEKNLKLQDIHDNYIINDQIAEGGHGIVSSAFDKSLKRDVVVKTVKSRNEEKSVLKDQNMFVSEARIMAKLDHPSIVPIYGMFSDNDDKLHLTMKHIRGKTLKAYLHDISVLYKSRGVEKYDERNSRLNRLGYLVRVCEAIDYAHCKGVIHRDIKPENIIIGSYGEIYIMDWGLACLFAPEEAPNSKHLTEIGLHLRSELAGTPCYLAPELIQGGLTSPQSDIFSLGMVLFEIVTLTRSAPGETVNDVLKNILRGNLNPFKHKFLKSRLSDDLKAIIAKATCPDLSRRYFTASEMAQDLKNYIVNNETSARPDNFSRKLLRKINHHIMLTSSIILSLFLLSAIIALYGLHSQNTLIRTQKTRASILNYFHHEVIAKSNKVNNTIMYFKNQLNNLIDHSEYLLSQKLNDVSMDHDAKRNFGVAVFKDYKEKLIDVKDVKMLALSKILKHVLITSNLRFKMANEKPITNVFVGFKNGSVLAYPGNKKHEGKCYPASRLAYKDAQKIKDYIILSKIFKCKSSSRIFISCLKGIPNNENKQIEVIGIDIDLEYIRGKICNTATLGEKEFLIDKHGKVILSTALRYKNAKINPKTNTLILEDFPFKKQFQEAIKERKMQFRGIINNKEYIFGINFIPSLDYYYVNQTSEMVLWKNYKSDFNKN